MSNTCCSRAKQADLQDRLQRLDRLALLAARLLLSRSPEFERVSGKHTDEALEIGAALRGDGELCFVCSKRLAQHADVLCILSSIQLRVALSRLGAR